jgi:RNA polymerase sigma factor (sigma-70 family)
MAVERLRGIHVVEDKLLIWKLRRGSRDALSRIYEKYRDDLLRIAAWLLNETSDAEDIVHDVFVVFVRSARQFQLTGSLRGYLATCVANKARNLNRAKSIQRTVNLDEIEPEAANFKRPEQWIINNEEFRQLNAAMGQLPYEQKEAVILHIQGRMKFREIAKIQETSIKTALSRYRYGLNKLRSIMNGEVAK